MNNVKYLLLLFATLAFKSLFAQEKVSVSGYVRDSSSLEFLSHATVLEHNSLNGTTSNTYGFFSLKVASGDIKLRVSYVGYASQEILMNLSSDTILDINLSAANDLKEIVVKAERGYDHNFQGHERIEMESVKELPGFAGEHDVLKSLSVLPGVQQGHEGSAGLFVRGGSPDQNLILLDGVPIYNATHLFGFVSVFTPEALQSVDFFKGGFPARYGGRLSSVIDVRMKEGNKKKYETDLTLGPISSKLTHQGPIVKGKSSYLISGRRTLLDLLLTKISKEAQSGYDEVVVPKLHFYDINAKMNFTLNQRNSLYASFYAGGDLLSSQFGNSFYADGYKIKQNTHVSLNWGNKVGALRWTSQLSDKLYLNSSVSSGFFAYSIQNKYNQSSIVDGINIENWSALSYETLVNNNKLQFLFDLYLKDHKIQFGTSGEINNYLPGQQKILKDDGTDVKRGNTHVENKGLAFFVDDKIHIGESLKMHAALRLEMYDLQGSWRSYLSPRVNVQFAPSTNYSISLSYDEMTQPLHLLTNSSIGLPSDIWVPATENTEPETSKQLSIGTQWQINNKFHYTLDSYYKLMRGVINYRAGYSFMDIYDNWETLVETGTGEVWGFENSLTYNTKHIKSWFNYTLAWNQREFDHVNNGKPFAFKFDRRHDLNLGLVYKVSKRFECSAVWVYQSGQAATILTQDYEAPGAIDYIITDFITEIEINDPNRIQIVEKYNNYRLPAFHHLDLGITVKKQKRKIYQEWKFAIYNVYARKNTYMYYPYTNRDGYLKYKKVSLFPIVPSISYQLKF